MAVYSNNVQALLDRITDLQAQIDALRPIKLELVNRVFQKFRLDWNYNSNSIEGNSLDYGETVAFVMEGLTAKGKPLKDHLDIKGHNEAINLLLEMQKHGTELMERDIRSLHEMILVEPYQAKAQTADGQATTKIIQLGVYKSSPNHVVTKTGEIHYYATPEETPALMQELMAWYREHKVTMHPLVLSTLFHHRFVNIHPFDDGNGRMSRLLSNLILMQAGFPPVVVRQDQRSEYYGVLSQADAGVTDPILEYFAGLLIHSLEIYLRGVRGEDISELSDLDKEIALFVSSFNEEDINKVPFSKEIAVEINDIVFNPYMEEMMSRLRKIGNLFFENTIVVAISIYNSDSYRVSEFKNSLPSIEDFFDFWVTGRLNKTFLNEINKNLPKDGSVRIVFSFNFIGFKAKESASPISVISMIDLEKSFYRVYAFAIDEALSETYSGRFDKHYPKLFTKNEWQEVVGHFFRGLMKLINDIYTQDAS